MFCTNAAGEIIGESSERIIVTLSDQFYETALRSGLAASITVPLQGRGLDASRIAADAGLATALRAAIDALASVARSRLGETRHRDGR